MIPFMFRASTSRFSVSVVQQVFEDMWFMASLFCGLQSRFIILPYFEGSTRREPLTLVCLDPKELPIKWVVAPNNIRGRGLLVAPGPVEEGDWDPIMKLSCLEMGSIWVCVF